MRMGDFMDWTVPRRKDEVARLEGSGPPKVSHELARGKRTICRSHPPASQVIMTALLLFAMIEPSSAHDDGQHWYPPECCAGSHCHPVPCQEIHALAPSGVQWHEYRFIQEYVKPSQDDQCHVCIVPSGVSEVPRCAFIRNDS
jgi:hypothetical protein